MGKMVTNIHDREYVYYNPYRDKIYVMDRYAQLAHPFNEMPELVRTADGWRMFWVKCLYLGVL